MRFTLLHVAANAGGPQLVPRTVSPPRLVFCVLACINKDSAWQFVLKIDYFKAFKKIDLSERGFPDHSGEHEGNVPSQKPRFVRKFVKDSFLSELDFSGRRPWWERGYEGRLHEGHIGGQMRNFGLVQRSFIKRASKETP